jgi:hypothetical protein
MSLNIGKEPVEKPCEADSFEEAYRKNKIRLSFERDLAAADYEQMKAKNDPHAESMNPDFWRGCESANESLWKVYQEEMAKVRERVIQRIQPLSNDRTDACGKGFSEVKAAWLKALKQNDPSVIVYW